jgi:hypothetical protein
MAMRMHVCVCVCVVVVCVCGGAVIFGACLHSVHLSYACTARTEDGQGGVPCNRPPQPRLSVRQSPRW